MMRVTPSGEVTIPAELRERCGLEPGTEVELEPVEGGLLLRPAPVQARPETPEERQVLGRDIVERLRAAGATGAAKFPEPRFSSDLEEYPDVFGEEPPEVRNARARDMEQFLRQWPGVESPYTTDEFMEMIRGPFEELEAGE